MDERTDEGGGTTDGDGATRPSGVDAGLEQFQRAALEAVQASRALLDAAESVLRDPAAVGAVVDTVTAFARMATGAVADAAARAGGARDDGAGAPPADDSDDDGPGGFERIQVD